MMTIIWWLSVSTAVGMLIAGSLKILVPRHRLMAFMKWARTWTDRNVKLLGVVEVMGAIGLIAPVTTGILPILTPIAALGITLLMCFAVRTQIALREPIVLPLTMGLSSGAIAAARLGLIGP
jgi:hypothetical protein